MSVYKGVLVKEAGEYAMVTVKRKSMCGHNCSECGICSSGDITFKALNLCGARLNDRVEIKMNDRTGFKASMLVYGIPVLLFFIGFMIAAMLNFSRLGNICIVLPVAIWFVVLFLHDKSGKNKGTFMPEIISKSE